MAQKEQNLDRAAFVQRFGAIYEHSPWVAEQVWDHGPPHTELAAAMAALVEAAGREAQLTLLRAHPELAGKLAVRGELTEGSRDEQAGAGLDQCSAEEFSEFQDLNAQYIARFGFPFILAVKGLGRADILRMFRQRVGAAPDEEFREALDQTHKIARLRLASLNG